MNSKALCLAMLVCCTFARALGSTYYASADRGNDANNGLSPQSPWKSLARVNGHSYRPGDIIRLHRDNMWSETLKLSSSGTRDRPITVTAYGRGARPVLSGGEVNIDNNEQSYITYGNLELRDAHEGLRLYSWKALLTGIILQNSVIVVLPAQPRKISAAVYASTRAGGLSHVLVRKNYIVPHRQGLNNWGIYFASGVTDFRIEDNFLGPAGEDGITIWHCSRGWIGRNRGGGNGENTIDVKDSEGIQIIGNTAVNDSEYNIVVHGVDSKTSTRRIEIRGNHCICGGQDGKLTAGIALIAVSDSMVINNLVEQSAGEAILIHDAAVGSSNRVRDNVLRGNGLRRASPAIVLQGTSKAEISGNRVWP
jgi:hypothetical protein